MRTIPGMSDRRAAVSVAVERADVGDFLEIAALDRIGWVTNADAEFVPDGEHVWRLWVEYAFVVTARQTGAGRELIGFALLFPTDRPSLWCFHKLLLSPSRRRQGTGRALVDVVTSFLDEQQFTAFFTTDPVNAAMQRLGVSTGFAAESLVRGYYRPNEDRLLFRRYPAPPQ